MRIFIIGPGGAGKSTAGELLAEKLGYNLIDLDQEFCKRIENIGEFFKKNNYGNYVHKNSELFFKLLEENLENTIFVLSSGFLVHEGHEEIAERHINAIKENGVSILLLPTRDIKTTEEIIVARQMQRGFRLKEDKVREKIRHRFPLYIQYGDIQIFSDKEPNEIAEKMEEKIKRISKERK